MSRDKSCPVPDGVEDLDVEGSSHNILLIVSAVSTAVTLISSMTLITLHLLRYRAPKEQRQIVRIVFAPFVFALVSLAEIYNYSTARYIDPISSFYEAICICALFLLYVQFAAPAATTNGTFGEELFDAIKAQQETTPKKGKGNWPRTTWIAVFQYPIAEIVAIVILEVTEATGTYCASSLRPRYGNFWHSVIQSVGMVVAIFSILRFYIRMKILMKARRGLAKITCFKLMVAVRLIQTVSIAFLPFFRKGNADDVFNQWLFSILIDQDVLEPSARLSYGDLTYGLPNALLCIESVLFSAIFWYAFSSAEYSTGKQQHQQQLPLWKAALHALNPYDIFHGVARAVGLVISRRQNGRDGSRAPAPVTRSGRGRYRTLEAVVPASRSHSQVPFQQSEDQGFREGSPPGYGEVSSELRPVDARYADRSPSPGVASGRYESVRGRDMV
jgi:hypothetical protein